MPGGAALAPAYVSVTLVAAPPGMRSATSPPPAEDAQYILTMLQQLRVITMTGKASGSANSAIIRPGRGDITSTRSHSSSASLYRGSPAGWYTPAAARGDQPRCILMRVSESSLPNGSSSSSRRGSFNKRAPAPHAVPSSGQLPRPRLAEGLQPDAVNQRVCLRLQPLFPCACGPSSVLPHRQPRIERRILKHKDPLRPRGAERRAVDLHLSALRRFQPPAAAAGLIYRSRKGPAAPRFPRAQLQANILQHRYRLFAKRKRMMKMADGYRRAALSSRLPLHPPRCQLSSRSRSINNPLIRPEHNKAITSSAAYILG